MPDPSEAGHTSAPEDVPPPAPPYPWTGAVLAGGDSARMGRPKAFLRDAHGRALIEAALDALRQSGATHLRIGANDPAAFAHLGVEVVPDQVPGRGPVGGLQALLHTAPTDWVLLVACDMPYLHANQLRRVLAGASLAREGQPLEAVIPRVAGRLQPLHALYHRRCAPKVDQALREGQLALTALADRLAHVTLELPDDPSYRNVNTPEDLDRFGLGAAPPGEG